MTRPIHISLDLETWGTTPGCDIRSIGAAVFDPVTGRVPAHNNPIIAQNGLITSSATSFYVACDNPIIDDLNKADHGEAYYTHWDTTAQAWRKYPLTRDPRTVQWWSEQSDEAQAAFADPVDLAVALHEFVAWLSCITKADTDLRLWSHGAHFDGPILAAAYKAVGLPVPWHYRAPRDTRTAFDMAGIDDHSAWLKQHPGPLGIPHHALDDSICQARAVCGAMARVGSVDDAEFEQLSVAMMNLSALMQRSGFLDDQHHHDAYEQVVKMWQNAIGHPDGRST